MDVGYIFGCVVARMEYGKIIEWSSTVWLQESVSSFYSIFFSTLFSNGSFVWLLFSAAVTSNRTCILKVICNDCAEGSKNGQTIKKNIRFFFLVLCHSSLCWCFFMRFHRFYYSKDNICTSRLKLLRAQMKKEIQVVANNPNVYTVYFKYRLRVFFYSRLFASLKHHFHGGCVYYLHRFLDDTHAYLHHRIRLQIYPKREKKINGKNNRKHVK